MTKKELICRIEICRGGVCHECPYSSHDKSCTDTLIDDVYTYLINEDIIECPYCGGTKNSIQYSTSTMINYKCLYCGKNFQSNYKNNI